MWQTKDGGTFGREAIKTVVSSDGKDGESCNKARLSCLNLLDDVKRWERVLDLLLRCYHLEEEPGCSSLSPKCDLKEVNNKKKEGSLLLYNLTL